MPSSTEPPPAGEFTIDELAAKTGVPSRTIRFYQSKHVLPAPAKRGRVAVYSSAHVERLELVTELQNKGLRLRAIRELVTQPDVSATRIRAWLGVGQQLDDYAQDEPQLLTEDEVREAVGGELPHVTLRELVRKGALEKRGEGSRARYLVESPQLLRISGHLRAAGISLDVALEMRAILERRLRRAAEELVGYAIDHIGRGFGRSSDPADLRAAIEALYPDGPGGEALRLIFAREISRVAAARFEQGDAATAVVKAERRRE